MNEANPLRAPVTTASLTWRWLLAAALLYSASVLVATYPVVWTFTSRMPGVGADHMQHLWVMRWYADCVRHLRWPGHAPGIQYPVGAPLGLFSPLHFQALVYVPLSWCTDNDVLCYNLIWLFNLLFTGIGSLILIWTVVGDQVSALVGGLLVMLSGPMLMHAHGHLELITLGWMPLFLAAWMRWLDQPSGRRLLGVTALYLLVTLSAAYYAVFVIIPALLYVVYQALMRGRAERWGWLRSRAPWLLGFGVAVLPCLAVLFLPQIDARAQGYTAPRTHGEFEHYGTPAWSYLVPVAAQGLGRLLGHDVYQRAGLSAIELCSYGGVVLLGLVVFAGLGRARLAQRGYWWTTLAFVLILSLGASVRLGGVRIPLPAEWLRAVFYPFQLIRCPCRFNLLAMILAAIVAAAGLRQLLDGWRSGPRRMAIIVLWIVAVADLGMGPFPRTELPACPKGYQTIVRRQPGAVFLEVPQFDSAEPQWLNAACAYWQSIHHGSTTAGYSGFGNLMYDQRIFLPSPFRMKRLGDDKYLDQPDAMSIDMVQNVRFLDYVWLYTQAHHIDYLVLHTGPEALPWYHPRTLERLRTQLQIAKIAEEEGRAFYDCRLLPHPVNGIVLAQEGWRQLLTRPGPTERAATPQARMIAYSPDSHTALRFSLTAAGLGETLQVHLQCDGRELAQWRVARDDPHTYESPAFHLTAGLHELLLKSDGQTIPRTAQDIGHGDKKPYSLRVAGVELHADASLAATHSLRR